LFLFVFVLFKYLLCKVEPNPFDDLVLIGSSVLFVYVLGM